MEMNYDLQLFRELALHANGLYLWSYDENIQLLHTNCPDLVLEKIFSACGLKGLLLNKTDFTRPLILSAPLGLMWIAVADPKQNQIHLLGPAFSTEISFARIEQELRPFDMELQSKSKLKTVLQTLPMVTWPTFSPYAIMLHYCVTREVITRGDLEYPEGEDAAALLRQPIAKKDRFRTWMAEQGLLRRIREGDLDYKQALSDAGGVSYGVQISTGDPTRQMKDSVIIFTSLACRASIEGGLTPEQAYSLGDMYILQTEQCRSMNELVNISHMMYEDFIQRVHRCRTNPNYSLPVQTCCDYIETHLEDPINIRVLAENAGYTDYYLSRKFKKEVGCSVNNYLNIARVERAKLWLESSEMTVQNIADRLQFTSESYFSTVFSQITGMPPSEYRRSKLRNIPPAPNKGNKTVS